MTGPRPGGDVGEERLRAALSAGADAGDWAPPPGAGPAMARRIHRRRRRLAEGLLVVLLLVTVPVTLVLTLPGHRAPVPQAAPSAGHRPALVPPTAASSGGVAAGAAPSAAPSTTTSVPGGLASTNGPPSAPSAPCVPVAVAGRSASCAGTMTVTPTDATVQSGAGYGQDEFAAAPAATPPTLVTLGRRHSLVIELPAVPGATWSTPLVVGGTGRHPVLVRRHQSAQRTGALAATYLAASAGKATVLATASCRSTGVGGHCPAPARWVLTVVVTP